MKVQFIEDYSKRKKGDKVEYVDRFAEFLISKGVAKKAQERKTKEEKVKRSDK